MQTRVSQGHEAGAGGGEGGALAEDSVHRCHLALTQEESET